MRKTSIINCFVAGVFCLVCACTWAHESSDAGGTRVSKRPAVIERLVQKGASVVDRFAATEDLTGWVVDVGGRRDIIYTTRSGGLISGDVTSADGTPLSSLHRVWLSADQPAGSQARAWTIATSSPLFTSVTPPPGSARAQSKVAIVFDPACPHCKDLISRIERLAASGKLSAEVRLLPVAVLSSNSTTLVQDFVRDKKVKVVSAALQDALKLNKSIMDVSSATSVPLVLFTSSRTGEVRALTGNPTDAVLAAILNP